jgi:hypothetical protein
MKRPLQFRLATLFWLTASVGVLCLIGPWLLAAFEAIITVMLIPAAPIGIAFAIWLCFQPFPDERQP